MRDLEIQIAEIKEKGSLSVSFELEATDANELMDITEFQVVGPVALTTRLSKAGATIRVVAGATFEVGYECGKCLEHQNDPVDAAAEFVLVSKAHWLREYDGDELELDASDLDVEVYSGDVIDLAPLFRETMLDSLPPHPVCPESRAETCDEMFKQNVGEEAIQEIEEASIDLRWGPLLELKKKKDVD